MDNRFSHEADNRVDSVCQIAELKAPSVYNIRSCPQCGEVIFGMPGGRDAACMRCGYKDPCCSD